MKNIKNLIFKKLYIFLLVFSLAFTVVSCGSTGSEVQPVGDNIPDDTTYDSTSYNDASINDTSTDDTSTDDASTDDYTYDDNSVEVVSTYSDVWTNSIGVNWILVSHQIKNISESDLYLSSCNFDIEDESGNLIEVLQMVSVYPEVIKPNETATYFTTTSVSSISDPSKPINIVPHIDYKEAKVDKITYDVTDVQLQSTEYMGIRAIGKVENTSSKDEPLTYVAVTCYDENDIAVAVLFTILDTKPGEKIGFEATSSPLPDDFTVEKIKRFEATAYPMQVQF